MDTLRKPFFLAAILLIALVVLTELGTHVGQQWTARLNAKAARAGRSAEAAKTENRQALLGKARQVQGMSKHLDSGDLDLGSFSEVQNQPKPPGVAIPFLAFLDGLIAFTMALMGAQLVWGERLQGRIQGIATLVASLLVVVGGIAAILVTLGQVLLMVGLFVSVPFGTLAYLAVWGSFKTGVAKAMLGVLLSLKLGLGACLLLAHPRFLQNKGLVLILATSLVANLVVSFLHALVPSILVSITDGVAGIIVLVLAVVWAIAFLIGSLISVVKAIA